MANYAAKQYPWASLKRIRQAYLGAQPITVDYWSDEELLELYDRSLGARIGWKWSAVLAELKSRGHALAGAPTVLDWGCGTGIAARAFLREFAAPKSSLKSLHVFDRSVRAEKYAREKVQSILTDTEISTELSTGLPGDHPDLILVSHVLTELDGSMLSTLKKRLQFAQSFIWVEPGTMHIGRTLPVIRDEFLKMGWEVLGPCPHQSRPCGLKAEAREKDWCHNFAPTPNEVHQDAFWAAARTELNIDLRRTPFTYLAMQRKDAQIFATATAAADEDASAGQLTRMLGEARLYKGYGKLLLCRDVEAPSGRQGEVGEFTLQKRDAPALLKAMKNGLDSPFLRFEFGSNQKVKVPASAESEADDAGDDEEST